MTDDAKLSFYGTSNVPQGNFRETNDPNFTEDLHGYYEMYTSSSPSEMANVKFKNTITII